MSSPLAGRGSPGGFRRSSRRGSSSSSSSSSPSSRSSSSSSSSSSGRKEDGSRRSSKESSVIDKLRSLAGYQTASVGSLRPQDSAQHSTADRERKSEKSSSESEDASSKPRKKTSESFDTDDDTTKESKDRDGLPRKVLDQLILHLKDRERLEVLLSQLQEQREDLKKSGAKRKVLKENARHRSEAKAGLQRLNDAIHKVASASNKRDMSLSPSPSMTKRRKKSPGESHESKKKRKGFKEDVAHETKKKKEKKKKRKRQQNTLSSEEDSDRKSSKRRKSKKKSTSSKNSSESDREETVTDKKTVSSLSGGKKGRSSNKSDEATMELLAHMSEAYVKSRQEFTELSKREQALQSINLMLKKQAGELRQKQDVGAKRKASDDDGDVRVGKKGKWDQLHNGRDEKEDVVMKDAEKLLTETDKLFLNSNGSIKFEPMPSKVSVVKPPGVTRQEKVRHVNRDNSDDRRKERHVSRNSDDKHGEKQFSGQDSGDRRRSPQRRSDRDFNGRWDRKSKDRSNDPNVKEKGDQSPKPQRARDNNSVVSEGWQPAAMQVKAVAAATSEPSTISQQTPASPVTPPPPLTEEEARQRKKEEYRKRWASVYKGKEEEAARLASQQQQKVEKEVATEEAQPPPLLPPESRSQVAIQWGQGVKKAAGCVVEIAARKSAPVTDNISRTITAPPPDRGVNSSNYSSFSSQVRYSPAARPPPVPSSALSSIMHEMTPEMYLQAMNSTAPFPAVSYPFIPSRPPPKNPTPQSVDIGSMIAAAQAHIQRKQEEWMQEDDSCDIPLPPPPLLPAETSQQRLSSVSDPSSPAETLRTGEEVE